MIKRFLKIASIIAASLFVISCSNIFETVENHEESNIPQMVGQEQSIPKITFKGTISLEGAFPEEICKSLIHNSHSSLIKSAMPYIKVDGSNWYYYVNAVQTEGGSGTFTIDGSTEEGRAQLVTVSNMLTFEIGLTPGTWDVTVSIRNSENVDALKETYNTLIDDETPIISHRFLLMPCEEGNGNVALRVSVPTSVTRISITCPALEEDCITVTKDEGSNTDFTINGSEVPSGLYYFTINCWASNDALIYRSVPKSVNIFDNLTTNTWIYDGISSYSSYDNYTKYLLQITESNIANYLGEKIYVGDSETGTASDTGDGSPFSPLRTIGEAVARIGACGKSDTSYTILINNTITENVVLSSSLNSSAKSIFIRSAGDTPVEVNGGGNGSVFTIETSTSVYFSNIIITGGSGTPVEGTSDTLGGGLYIKQGGKVFLSDYATITGNTATKGGGIYLKNATFKMIDKSLVGDSVEITTAATTSEYGNIATKGGGIFNDGGYIWIGCDSEGRTGWAVDWIHSDYGIRHNYATEDGGGIYFENNGIIGFNSAHISYNGCGRNGGGFYVDNPSYTCTLHYGKIFKNSAKHAGGAIYLASGTIKCTNAASSYSTIEENYVEAEENQDALGGGIYNAGTLKLTQYIRINSNTATTSKNGNAYGGAIYNAGTILMESSNPYLESNIAKVTGDGTGSARGGAIYNSDSGEITMKCGYVGDTNKLNIVEGTTAQGGGIYQNGTLNMSSSARILAGSEKNNDLYLPNGKKIGIASDLSKHATDKQVFVTSEVYNETTQLLEKSGTITDADFASACTKFKLADDDWLVNSEGMLVSSSFSISGVSGVPSLTLAGEGSNDSPYELQYNRVNRMNISISGGSGSFTTTSPHGGTNLFEINTDTPSAPVIQFKVSAQKGSIASGSNTYKYDIKVKDNVSGKEQLFYITLPYPSTYGYKTSSSDFAVGDIVFTDGSAVPYYEGMLLTNEQKNKTSAVIFYKGTGLSNNGSEERTLGVSKGNAANSGAVSWCLDSAKGYNFQFDTITVNPDNLHNMSLADINITGGQTNGSDTYTRIGSALAGDNDAANDSSTPYKAFYYCKNYGDGFYLPSIAELAQVCKQKTTLETIFTLVGGDAFADQYWSSTQSTSVQNGNSSAKEAYSLLFSNPGTIWSADKSSSYSMRPIREY